MLLTPTLLPRLKHSLRLTSLRSLLRRLRPMLRLLSSKLKKMPKRLLSRLRSNCKESLLKRLEQSLLPFKLEMMKLLLPLLRPPSKLLLSRRLPLLPLLRKLNKIELLWLLMIKFKLPLRNSKDSKLPRPLYSPNKKPMRELLNLPPSKKLLDSLKRQRRKLTRKKLLPRLPLPLPKLLPRLQNKRLMRTQSLLKLRLRELLRRRDSKEKLPIPQLTNKRWLKRLLLLPRLKLRSKLLRKDKLLLLLLFRRQRLRDKELRMRRPLLSNKERRMREESLKPSKKLKMLPIERLLPLTELRNLRLNQPLLRLDLRQISRLLRMPSRLTLRSSRNKESPTRLDLRLWLISKLLPSRPLKKLLRRLTSKLSLLERPKRRDKSPTMPRRWLRGSLNLESNSSMFGFLAQLASPK